MDSEGQKVKNFALNCIGADMTPERLDQTPLQFGEHKGKTPCEVALIDPDYLLWVAGTAHAPISSDALLRACKACPLKYRHESRRCPF